jgi:hypothetical protein
MFTDVSEVLAASIFRTKSKARRADDRPKDSHLQIKTFLTLPFLHRTAILILFFTFPFFFPLPSVRDLDALML